MVVRRLTSPDYTYDEGPWNLGYSGRVDLVELVDGEVSTRRLVESVVCHYDGQVRCPVATGSPAGWLVLNYPNAGEVDEDATVWTFDARALLPTAPSVGRVITVDQEERAWPDATAVGERLLLAGFNPPGVGWTALDGDDPIETLSTVASRVRRIAGTQTVTLEGDGLVLFDVENGSQTRLDDPDSAEPAWPLAIAADGSRLAFGQDGAAFEVPLDQGAPGPIRGLDVAPPEDGAMSSMQLSPDGSVAWWAFIDFATQDSFGEYVGLGGAEPVERQPLGEYTTARWSATTETIMHWSFQGQAISVVDPQSTGSTLIEPSVDVESWRPCGPGVIVESESDGLWWFGVEGEATRLADSGPRWLCSSAEDYVAYVGDDGLFVRSMGPEGLGAREEMVTGRGDGYIPWLDTSADSSTLVFLWCPAHVSGWPHLTCPGILGAWDVETSTAFVLLDEHYIIQNDMGSVELPPVREGE